MTVVRFDYTGPTLPVDLGVSSGTRLELAFVLGAVDAATTCQGMPTDAAGKAAVRRAAMEAARGVHDAIESIGWLMAYCEIENIPKHHLSMVGWTLAGLGRLGHHIMNVAEMAAAEEAAP